MKKYKILKQMFTVILVIAITVTGVPINSYANDAETKAQTIDIEQALKNKTENDNIPSENENINNTNDNELMKDNQEEEENEDESSDDGINTEGNNQNQENQNIDKEEEQVSDENNGEKVDDTHDFDNDNSNENVEENIEGNKDDNSENGSLNNESDGDNKNANLDKEEDDLDKLDESNNKKQANELSSVVISNVAGRSKVNIYIGNEFYEHLDGETSDDMLIIEPKGTIIRLEAIDYPGADPTHIFNCWFVQSQLSNTYITDSIIEFNIEDYIKVTPWHNANLKPEEKEVIISGDSVIEIPYKNDVTKNYTAEVYDESGDIIEDSTITWSLKDKLVGVNINQTGGVTVTSEATVGNFTIIAITQNGTKGEMQIQLSPYAIPDAPNLTADDINNIITGQDANRENMEYTIGDSDNWETYDSDNPPDLTMDVVIKLRFIGTETIPPSNITTLQFNYNYIENFNDDKEIYTDIQSDNRGYLSVKHYDIANESQVDENDRVKMFGDERYSDFIIQTPLESAYGDYFDMYNESQQGSLYFEANYNNNSHEAFEKAIVMWGYFVPEKTGEYQLYAYSDDGIYGSLTFGNEDKIFVNKWQYQSPSTRGNGTVYQMQEGKIYPIYMNFFENRKSQSAFKLQMSFNGNTIEDVPGTYLYPSSKNLAYNNNVPVMDINVEPESTIINIDENDSITLNATIEPVNATNKNINWSSSDDSIATVDSHGNVTLNKVGVVTITATTEDGNYEDNCVITINSNISGDPDDFFYASDNKGTLVKYYPYRNSNKTDKIASKIDDYRDIATLPDGTLVGVTQNGNLYKNIELGIDEREKIGPGFYINNEDNHSYFNDFYGVNALTSDSNGNLYYVEEDYGIIRKYDITNNEITDVVATGLSSAGDIVFLDANTIYYTAYDYWNYYYLVKVNITTKQVSQIARLSGIPYGIASLNSKLFVTYANNNKSYVDVYDPEGNKLNDRSEKINHLKKVFGAAQGIGKIVSNPPVAKDVRIEGSAKVGEEFTGLYTYEDSEGDEEGNSRYQWYKSERDSSSYTPINYATTKKLLITEDLIGCTIKFEVTPIAKTGTYLEGNAVRSNPTEKVVPLPFKLIGPYDYDYFYLNDRNGKIIKYYPESDNYEQVAHTNKTYLDIANYNDDIIGVRDGKLYKNITTNPIKIKEISDSTINSLTYNNGLYYYVEGTKLYAYNPNTETFYELKDIGYTSQGDLVAFEGDMYFLAATGNGYYTKLIKIDFDNNYSTSVIGEYYSGYSMGIAAANDTLFVGYSNLVAKVNLQTGYLYDETRIRGLNNIYGAAQGGYANPVSSEAGLQSLAPIDEPTFNSSTTNYIKYLEPGTITRPDVVYETIDSNATVEVIKDSQTEVEGITTVIVTAEDRITTMTYTVEFILHHRPVIELNGNKIVVVDYNGSYTDAGAKAFDIEDDNDTLTEKIETTVTKPNGTIVPYVDGIIDTKIPGNYTIHYNVTDSTGYMADEVTRTVVVMEDEEAPVITLVGNATEEVTYGGTYTDAGATAYDNRDGDITDDIVVTITKDDSLVDEVSTVIHGTYIYHYNVSDEKGNQAQEVTRTVVVKEDEEAPVITLVGNDNEEVTYGGTYVDEGATALDNRDGDITEKILVTITKDGSLVDEVSTVMPGTYIYHYNVSDEKGNEADEVTRTVVVKEDEEAPVITLVGNDSEEVTYGGTYTDAGATAYDNRDGDITEDIVVTITKEGSLVDAISTVEPGTYIYHYNVTDEKGNQAQEVTRTIVVKDDEEAPVITLVGNASEEVTYGGTYTDAGATAYDNRDGNITDDIVVTITKDGSTIDEISTIDPGTYIYHYNVTDERGNQAQEVTRTVVVKEDEEAPVITLVGNSLEEVTYGEEYNDAGATALDNRDGDISENIVVTITKNGENVGEVSTNEPGTYIYHYNVSDEKGNEADEVTRTVVVKEDEEAPVITLVGNDNEEVTYGGTYVDEGATALDNRDGDITENIVVTITKDGSLVDAISTNEPGTYIYHYNVSDEKGNEANEVTRTVVVKDDEEAPVITLVGNDNEEVTYGGTYTDAGATAYDNRDGDITEDIVVTITKEGSLVDAISTVIPGTYIYHYNVSDEKGNQAQEVTRTVVVKDDEEAPVITLVGNVSEEVTYGGTYTDAGATALDNRDGDISENIVVTITKNGENVGEVSTNEPGTYIYHYNVSDEKGNEADEVTRTVVVKEDEKAPVITLVGNDNEEVTYGGTYVDAGATAYDNRDGDITEDIVVTITKSGEVVDKLTTNEPGTYIYHYNVSDEKGNEADEVTRTVVVKDDEEAPVITLVGNVSEEVTYGGTYTDAGVTALDNRDGDISENIVVTITKNGENVGEVSTNEPGTYIYHYNVTDEKGNQAQEVIRTVVVKDDEEAPVITLVGNASEEITYGGTYVDAGATAYDNRDGDISENIVVTITKDGSLVDEISTNEPGTYIYHYNVSDEKGNEADEVTRTIVVKEDEEAPVITLTGNDNEEVTYGGTYVDEGATALDNRDGDITENIVVTITKDGSLVDAISTNEPGTYIYHYNVSDEKGNEANEVTRTVVVKDDEEAPVITLVGNDNEEVTYGGTYTDAGATAYDNRDGDITEDIVVTITKEGSLIDAISTVIPGTYIYHYNVSDEKGNQAEEVIRTVIVKEDEEAPVITLVGNTSEEITYGGTYVDAGATALDNRDGDITENIVVTITKNGIEVPKVDEEDPGTYIYHYNVTDEKGNEADEVTRTVVVKEDEEAPVITLVGNASEEVTYGGAYVDAGATALDNRDGDISENIVVTITKNGESVGEVSTNEPGTYIYHYNVSDEKGNQAQEVTRTVVVKEDEEAPVITLVGNASEEVAYGGTYVDAGATAYDNRDGDLTEDIVVTITKSGEVVDKLITNVPGTYIYHYNVSDEKGNEADEVTRTIVVKEDEEAPVITLTGNDNEEVTYGGTYVDAGATAYDNRDGDITEDIVVTITKSGEVVDKLITNVPGTYIYHYNVTDEKGNEAQEVTRTVVVKEDQKAPVITLVGNALEDVIYGGTYVDAGATAYDNRDGDITEDIVVTITKDGSLVDEVSTVMPGTYIYHYNVSDEKGNEAQEVTRTVVVKEDQEAPVITLVGNASEKVIYGGTYLDAGATAYDNRDGDITEDIVVTITKDGSLVDEISTVMPGIYIYRYNVSDEKGNEADEVTRTVVVKEDEEAPVITLVGNASEEVIYGGAYVDSGATALDNRNGDISENIVVTITKNGENVGEVSTNEPGTYIYHYNVSDEKGNEADEVTRIVIVKDDEEAPVITLVGNVSEEVTYGEEYNDAGTTALDNRDGDISENIVVTITKNGIEVPKVDEEEPGTYIYHYNVSDEKGNQAQEVIRTVVVKDDEEAPAITLVGNVLEEVTYGGMYTDAGATAYDNRDGDISENIVVTITKDGSLVDEISTIEPGTYIYHYNVSDEKGNEANEVTRTVVVKEDEEAPIITLVGNERVEVTYGGTYKDAGATALDNKDGDITENIVVTITKDGNLVESISTNVSGTYIYHYNVSDEKGNKANEITRMVIVKQRPSSGGGDTPSGGGDTPSGGGDNPSGGDNNPSDGGDTTDDNEDGDLDEEIIIDEPTTPLGAIEFYDPYIKGFPDGSFKPKKAVTRAEVAAMFARILKLDTEESGDASYTDVTNAHWAYKYIQAITKIGLFKGYNDGTFKPNQAIKRAEIAVVFSAYWDYVGAEVEDDESIFTDISGHWAQSYINKLYNAGVVKGFEDKTFRPDTDTAREQIVIMINKIIARPKLDAVNPSFSDVSNDHWAYGDIEAASVKFNKDENNEEKNQDSEDQQ
ncbi:DUF4073 domain-containing protein [Vallitalea guaymasensis]|uniref:DUF4073 domain-containing protein n=1 Tax=Vallitalea guaymasensis TaxID=1185412 RepID=A0A8J8SEE2_9FIRM|nr:DUF4073 domain-containing protein [Vallitalea guaymasensis]QUH31792.1 DUF4073 domain-containing protein [Vallitalea guaymasensis]